MIEDDPLLRRFTAYLTAFHSTDTFFLEQDPGDWSDDEGPSFSVADATSTRFSEDPVDLDSALRRIRVLEQKLSRAQRALVDYRTVVAQKIDIESLAEIASEPGPSTKDALRDDDSHYFQSYGATGVERQLFSLAMC